jgi:hypothetical protein
MQVSKTLRLGFESLLARQFKDISNSMNNKAEVKEQLSDWIKGQLGFGS